MKKIHHLYRPILTSRSICAAAAILCITPVFSAVNLDWVTVGNAGNAADTTGYGAVSYAYQIGKYEVTNAQYGEFLNAAAKTDSHGLYNSNMAEYGITKAGSSGNYTYSVTGALANHPVVYVSWFDAARFANWLCNGQGNGDTETGAYSLNGAMSGIFLANAEASVYLPNENEWYKAAYYNGINSTYSAYPNGQNTITTSDANYNGTGSKDVGSYSEDSSFYGTFDQGGNVLEWNDTVITGGSNRVLRGGSWKYSNVGDLNAGYRNGSGGRPDVGDDWIGFRIAAVPEPCTLTLASLAGVALLARRRR